MSVNLLDNLSYLGKKPSFSRDLHLTLEEMKNFNPNFLSDMYISCCIETGKVYCYNVNNEFDETLGKWREIIGSTQIGDIEASKDEDSTYISSVEVVSGTSEDIECTKTVTTIGNEITTIVTANVDSSDVDVLKAGDIVSITKEIDGIVVYEYSFLDSAIVSPFD